MSQDGGTPTTTATTTVTMTSTDSVTKDELLDLVRAIKFAKPDASMRQVHKEITETLSLNESFEFLSQIPLTDVKKVWKKAVKESSAKRQQEPGSLPPLLAGDNHGQPWKLFTVGDGSVQSLAHEYSQAAAKEAAAAAIQQQQQHQPHHQQHASSEEEQAQLWKHYVHVFLNVPADRSGQRPHQAIINFNQNSVLRSTTNATGRDSSSSTTAARNAARTTAGNTTHDVICKIQVAAASDGTKYPMLLYNQDRTIKTFIHPDYDDSTTSRTTATTTTTTENDDGYDRLFRMITSQGLGGALGAMGGTKAYFFATKRTIAREGAAGKNAPTDDVLSIDTRRLADPQSW